VPHHPLRLLPLLSLQPPARLHPRRDRDRVPDLPVAHPLEERPPAERRRVDHGPRRDPRHVRALQLRERWRPVRRQRPLLLVRRLCPQLELQARATYFPGPERSRCLAAGSQARRR